MRGKIMREERADFGFWIWRIRKLYRREQEGTEEDNSFLKKLGRILRNAVLDSTHAGALRTRRGSIRSRR